MRVSRVTDKSAGHDLGVESLGTEVCTSALEGPRRVPMLPKRDQGRVKDEAFIY